MQYPLITHTPAHRTQNTHTLLQITPYHPLQQLLTTQLQPTQPTHNTHSPYPQHCFPHTYNCSTGITTAHSISTHCTQKQCLFSTLTHLFTTHTSTICSSCQTYTYTHSPHTVPVHTHNTCSFKMAICPFSRTCPFLKVFCPGKYIIVLLFLVSR